MTSPAVVRIFFAIDLLAESKTRLGQLIGSLKKKARSSAIRWTRPENLHITLQFLAKVQTEHVPVILEQVRKKLAESKMPLPRIQIGKLQVFPNPFRPRVIVLEIQPQEPLMQLSNVIGQGILATGYEIDTRPYRAHMTIGRIKHSQHTTVSFLTEFSEFVQEEALAIGGVTLFRSDPQPEGSQYTALAKLEW